MKEKENEVLNILKNVRYPGYSRDIVSFGFVKKIEVDDEGNVVISLKISSKDQSKREEILKGAKEEVKKLKWVKEVQVLFVEETPPGLPQKKKPEGVKRIIAVSSAKGGVGKSIIAVNLAVGLRKRGYKSGILDTDVFGPSIPLLMGIKEKPTSPDGKNILPVSAFGVKAMSIGFFLNPDTPVIWRGPMVMKLMDQFFNEILWEDLDFLVIDLPPGTGDVQLSMAQMLYIDWAIIVTTPQKIALADVRRGIEMFKSLDVPILGIVENMAYMNCPHCGKRVDVFPGEELRKIEKDYKIPVIASIPIEPEVSRYADLGKPSVEFLRESKFSCEVERIVDLIESSIKNDRKDKR
jgi:ATP-binding protein involved in chromosome partitioning